METLLDLETDLEAELTAGNHRHSIAVCADHRGPQWFPINGTIVEAVCGKLFRWRTHVKEAKKCIPCGHFQGKRFNCFVCNKEIFG